MLLCCLPTHPPTYRPTHPPSRPAARSSAQHPPPTSRPPTGRHTPRLLDRPLRTPTHRRLPARVPVRLRYTLPLARRPPPPHAPLDHSGRGGQRQGGLPQAGQQRRGPRRGVGPPHHARGRHRDALQYAAGHHSHHRPLIAPTGRRHCGRWQQWSVATAQSKAGPAKQGRTRQCNGRARTRPW